MKICDLALFSPDSSSGVKTYIESKMEYVRRRADVDHVVIVPGDRERTSASGRSKVIVVRGVPSTYPGIRLALNFWKVADIVERERPDVIELNCQYTLPWAAFLSTRRSRTPIIGIYHTDLPACARHLARGAGDSIARIAEWVAEWYEGLIYRHCTVTVVLNPGMQDRMRRFGVTRVCCLPCGVDVETFSPAHRDPAWRARLGIPAGSIVLLYVGRLSAEKEIDVLLDAYDRLPTSAYSLVIAGDGPDSAAVSQRAKSRPGVHYIGHVESRTELAVIYSSSDIFLIPGRYETFGMSTLEALASGLPVVGIRDSGTSTFVPGELGMLAQAGDAADVARAIGIVATWPLSALRAACHTFARTDYSWNAVFDRYFELYRQVTTAHAEALAS